MVALTRSALRPANPNRATVSRQPQLGMGCSSSREVLPKEVQTAENAERPLLVPGDASLTSSVANLANTTVGVGILTLPHAISTAGLYSGFVLLVCIAIFSTFSSHLLSECADVLGRPSTYSQVAEAAFPRRGVSVLLDIALIANSWGIGLAYFIVTVDSMPPVFDALVGLNVLPAWGRIALAGREFWIAFSLAVVSPLCLLRRIGEFTSPTSLHTKDSNSNRGQYRSNTNTQILSERACVGDVADDLRLASVLVLLSALTICAALVAFAFAPSPAFDPCGGTTSCTTGPIVFARSPLKVLRAVPPFLFSYAAQFNVVPVTNELSRPTPRRTWFVFIGAYVIASLLYAVVSAAGYQTFGDAVRSNVLLSYPEESGTEAATSVAVVRLLQVYVALLSYPVVSYPCWTAIDSLLGAATCGRIGGHDRLLLGGQAKWVTDPEQRVVIGAYVIATSAVALVVSDLGIVVSLVGATASVLIFSLPGAAYFMLYPNPRFALKRALAFVLGASGFVLMPACVMSVLS